MMLELQRNQAKNRLISNKISQSGIVSSGSHPTNLARLYIQQVT